MFGPALLATVLVAGLLALLPVRRLQLAGWPRGALFTTWLVFAAGLVLVVRLPMARFLVPILVLALLAPYVAGPERLARVLRGSARPTVKDVTPRPPRLPPGDGDGPGSRP